MALITNKNSEWHWPFFPETLCGTMNDRERLGLPEHYVSGRLDQSILASTNAMYGLTKEQLVKNIADKACSLSDRIACGNLLALLGDPRISTFEPDMVHVTGGNVEIGLAKNLVENVLDDFQGLGLNRIWIEKECPAHDVNLNSFRMGRHQVTNVEYRDFLLDSGYSEIPTSWEFRRFPQERSNHPVHTITAEAADAYVKWLSVKTQRNFRLPTEAEWEWSAKGPDGREFPWGDSFDADFANTCETGLFTSTPVGVFLEGASPFGLLDMAGNVEEYVADSYSAYPDGDFVKDHLVDIHGDYRVARGGGFSRYRDLLRTRRRHGHNPRSLTYVMGFRLAETL